MKRLFLVRYYTDTHMHIDTHVGIQRYTDTQVHTQRYIDTRVHTHVGTHSEIQTHKDRHMSTHIHRDAHTERQIHRHMKTCGVQTRLTALGGGATCCTWQLTEQKQGQVPSRRPRQGNAVLGLCCGEGTCHKEETEVLDIQLYSVASWWTCVPNLHPQGHCTQTSNSRPSSLRFLRPVSSRPHPQGSSNF